VARVVLFLFLLFALLLVLRALRVFLAGFLNTPRETTRPPAEEQEMVRDSVCGTWIDRRLALAARRKGEWVPVCSEGCRKRLESRAESG
jgi:hypothetical protein